MATSGGAPAAKADESLGETSPHDKTLISTEDPGYFFEKSSANLASASAVGLYVSECQNVFFLVLIFLVLFKHFYR